MIFHLKYENEINSLANTAKVTYAKYFAKQRERNIHPFIPLKDYLNWQKENEFFELPYFSETIKYPIASEEIVRLIESFVIFYPIYDNHVRLCCGRQTQIKKQINLLTDWLISLMGKKEKIDNKLNKELISSSTDFKKLAETKIKVMPALRWQVFQRDNWRCLSCGRTSEDGIILHIDHIIPRSKGGQDHIDNYQTLCDICNIGKSNKDQTNLRNR